MQKLLRSTKKFSRSKRIRSFWINTISLTRKSMTSIPNIWVLRLIGEVPTNILTVISITLIITAKSISVLHVDLITIFMVVTRTTTKMVTTIGMLHTFSLPGVPSQTGTAWLICPARRMELAMLTTGILTCHHHIIWAMATEIALNIFLPIDKDLTITSITRLDVMVASIPTTDSHEKEIEIEREFWIKMIFKTVRE